MNSLGTIAIEAQTVPRVSVVLPTRNRPDLLAEALQSVVNQTMPYWEAIVVDDASDPPTDANAFRERFGSRVNVRRHPVRRGGAAAKNTGIEAATAPVVAFLDDDDLYAPDYLTCALDVLDRHRDLDGLFMSVSWFGRERDRAETAYRGAMSRALALTDGVEREPGVLVFGPQFFMALLQTVPMAFQRPVVRRAALGEIGLYEAHCLLWDCDWAVRAAVAHRFGLVLNPLYRQRAAGQGTISRPDRALDHLRSLVEIKDRLLANAASYGLSGAQRRAVRESAASAWFSLAHLHCADRRDLAMALSAWFQGQRRHPSLRHTRFLGRVLQTALTRRKTQPSAT